MRRTKRELRQRRVAYHEAGHAVAAVHLAALDWVTIDPKGNGLTRWSGLRAFGELDNHLAIMLAGPAAEQRASPCCIPGCLGDYENASEIIYSRHEAAGFKVTDATVAGAFTRAKENAAALVANHWRKIEAVALALLVSKKLSSRAVHKIMRATP